MAQRDPQAGETLEVLLHASDNAGRHIRPAPGSGPGAGTREPRGAVARFWGPDEAPGVGPAAYEVTASWDEQQHGYVALADTGGWAPGTYHARGEVTGMTTAGPARGWSRWVTITLRPA